MNDEALLEALEAICERLTDRTATLFLGAGINAGAYNEEGEPFPLGQGLANWIACDLLHAPDLDASLDDVAEIAQARLGESAVNQYIYEKFSGYRPSTAHLSLVQLPWDVIYTTNYDLLIESAAQMPSIQPAGTIRSIYSIETDLSPFTESDILYYKLHGTVDYANTDAGRLILTKDDYRHYDRYRKTLFKRLERDLQSRTFVFVGYGLRDGNLRAILDDCREVLGTSSFPLSYAIRTRFTDVEETFWRDKYNIQLVSADAAEFLNTLKDTWIARGRPVVPFEERQTREYLQVDQATRFSKVAESFYRVRPADCTGPSNPKLFFRGREPSWGDIRDGIGPPRDAYWALFDALFPELAKPDLPPSAYLVTGAAGTGKTTLVFSLAYGLARDFDLPVLVHIPGTPLDARFLRAFVNDAQSQRVIVIVRHAADVPRPLERFMEDATRLNLPVTVILEERKNQWMSASIVVRGRFAPPEFELGMLSEKEIADILDALAAYEALGKLTGSPREYQTEHFTALADKELLVALRELTTGGSFDAIIEDEFNQIPSEAAKQAYVYVAALGQIDLAIRYETLIGLLQLRYDQLGSEIFTPAEGVLISGEQFGNSRHNVGFTLRARHPVIASIIFALVAPDDEAKLAILNSLITHLDPGYVEDRRLLEDITRRRDLVSTLADPDKRRSIYERLATLLPNNPYVLQHRSILERELEDFDRAIKYSRDALRIEHNNPVFKNTLGMALEAAARNEENGLRRRAFINEATQIFDDGIQSNPADPYGYVGKAYVMRQAVERERDPDRKAVLRADVLSLLEDAYEATGESSIIAGQLAKQWEEIGTVDDAIGILRTALQKSPADTRLRDLWSRLEANQENPEKALNIAIEGTHYDPTSWRLQRQIARQKAALRHPIEAVKGHYEAAMRHRRGDIGLMVEFGAYMFKNRMYPEATAIFSQSKSTAKGYERQQFREWWVDEDGEKQVFQGRVHSLRGVSAQVVAVPENFLAFFWRTDPRYQNLREGDAVTFTVGFNAYGPSAFLILP